MLLRDYTSFCSIEIRKTSQDDVQRVINYLSLSKSPKTDRNYHGLIASVIGSDLALKTSIPLKISGDEIFALTLDDIQSDVIHVHHSLVLGTDKEWHLKAPKTGSSNRYISGTHVCDGQDP